MRGELGSGKSWKRIAWQGITLSVPGDWSFSAFGGDWQKGSFRVDAPADTFVELEWSRATGKPNLKKEFDASIARMRGKLKRARGSIEVKEKPGALAGVRQGGGVPLTFSLRGDSLAYGALWHCAECGRLVLAKVVGPARESLGPLAHAVLDSIQDHGDDEGVLWSVYGFSFRAPADLRLVKQSLRSGHLALEFVRVRASAAGRFPLPLPGLSGLETEDRRRTLAVERWGLADVILRRDGFQTWVMGALWPRMKSFDYGRESAEVHGHEAVRLQGRRAGVRALLKRLPSLLLRRDPVDALRGCAWVCPESNRIFAVLATGGRDEAPELAEAVASSIECHP